MEIGALYKITAVNRNEIVFYERKNLKNYYLNKEKIHSWIIVPNNIIAMFVGFEPIKKYFTLPLFIWDSKILALPHDSYTFTKIETE